jgi:UDP-2,3-diacylglucosamine pyrophosphatase LpxH
VIFRYSRAQQQEEKKKVTHIQYRIINDVGPRKKELCFSLLINTLIHTHTHTTATESEKKEKYKERINV